MGKENMETCRELSGYLEDSFGNSQRVDYGTGHETTFFVFLCCLYKALVLKKEDIPAFANATKETIDGDASAAPAPAPPTSAAQPSHGVWCLDDYQLLPFLFGSAQLIGNTEIPPSAVNNNEVIEKYSSEYMYLEAIKFINIVLLLACALCVDKDGSV